MPATEDARIEKLVVSALTSPILVAMLCNGRNAWTDFIRPIQLCFIEFDAMKRKVIIRILKRVLEDELKLRILFSFKLFFLETA